MSRRGSQRLAAALVAACALTVAAGCGSDDGKQATGDAEAVGPLRAGSVASLAQCSDWRAGTRAERIATIHDIREQVNQTGAAEPTTDLGDHDAYALLERACAQPFATGFRLYKIYTRGAAFSSLSE